jgi:hypothetical protein
MADGADGRTKLLKWLIAFSLISTSIHFTHNFAEVGEYPSQFAGWTVQVAIVLSWPILTAIGIRGYLLYREGRRQAAHRYLAAYSVLGISTLGHFLEGTPDVPAFFFATIFTDGLAGLSILAFVLLSMRAERQGERGGPATGEIAA